MVYLLAMHTSFRHYSVCSMTTIDGTVTTGCLFLPNRCSKRLRMDSFGGTSEIGTMRLERRLNMLPKHNATTVQVRMITLYGMLKSGVGRDNNRLVVLTVYSPEFSVITAAL